MDDHLFLKACRMESVSRPPVWIMRQAGRIIPDYRRIRETYSFQELMKNPAKVAEVTIQPVNQLGVDAAILFTDILILPEAMGQRVEYVENEGPVIHGTVQESSDLADLETVEPENDLDYVLESIERTVDRLDGRVPLIGFAGAPWTLACYMIEGGSSRRYTKAKGLLYSDLDVMESLLAKITNAVISLLVAQVEAGARAVQLFDTSAGTLPPGPYTETILPCVHRIVESIHAQTDVPVIYYSKGTGHSFDQLLELDVEVIGLDWTVSMQKARAKAGKRVALQGNLDPVMLLSSTERITHEVHRVIEEHGSGPGHIFNLGHGVYPETKLEHVKAMVRAVKSHGT